MMEAEPALRGQGPRHPGSQTLWLHLQGEGREVGCPRNLTCHTQMCFSLSLLLGHRRVPQSQEPPQPPRAPTASWHADRSHCQRQPPRGEGMVPEGSESYRHYSLEKSHFLTRPCQTWPPVPSDLLVNPLFTLYSAGCTGCLHTGCSLGLGCSSRL